MAIRHISTEQPSNKIIIIKRRPYSSWSRTTHKSLQAAVKARQRGSSNSSTDIQSSKGKTIVKFKSVASGYPTSKPADTCTYKNTIQQHQTYSKRTYKGNQGSNSQDSNVQNYIHSRAQIVAGHSQSNQQTRRPPCS
jgi:hypothetical protein